MGRATLIVRQPGTVCGSAPRFYAADFPLTRAVAQVLESPFSRFYVSCLRYGRRPERSGQGVIELRRRRVSEQATDGESVMSHSVPKKVHGTGLIQVKTYIPTPYDEPPDGPKLVRISVTETFSGDVEGEGTVEFLQAIRSDGSASFVGIERVVGKISGRSGSFVLQDAGTLVGKTDGLGNVIRRARVWDGAP